MKVKLVSKGILNTQPLDTSVVAAMEAGFMEIANREREYREESVHPSLLDFVKGEKNGLKLAAHALGYKFEEGVS
jgi:hypothetical protein